MDVFLLQNGDDIILDKAWVPYSMSSFEFIEI